MKRGYSHIMERGLPTKMNPWRLEYNEGLDQSFLQINSFDSPFDVLQANKYIDIYSKRVGLKAASCVVSVRVYSGNKMIRSGSGFIIECNTSDDGCSFNCIILTSTTLLRTSDHALISLLDNIKVLVVAANHKEYESDIVAHDFHYNLAVLAIKVDQPLEVAKLRCLDDLPALESQLHLHSDKFKLANGTQVLALGRSCDESSGIMIAPGFYSTDKCKLDCKELLEATCLITKVGIGGPIINLKSEVIGVNFFSKRFTPFLPINVASKWWTHFKKTGENCRPWFGAKISNFENGIVVDEITPNSPADSAKVLVGDIIVEFNEKVVRSTLQLYELIWELVGKSVQLVVMRTHNSRVELSITIGNAKENDQFNGWPLEGGDARFFPNVDDTESDTDDSDADIDDADIDDADDSPRV